MRCAGSETSNARMRSFASAGTETQLRGGTKSNFPASTCGGARREPCTRVARLARRPVGLRLASPLPPARCTRAKRA
eukprot:2827210-Prymnesium_polylepis.1